MIGFRAKKPSRWDKAVADLNDLFAQLDVTSGPADRAALYERAARAEEAASRAVDLNAMPPLDSREGISYAQAYADAARLCRILAAGERAFGTYRRGAVRLPGVPREHRDLWEQYLASADRSERAVVLFSLYDLTAHCTGHEGADPLNVAAWSERALSGLPRPR